MLSHRIFAAFVLPLALAAAQSARAAQTNAPAAPETAIVVEEIATGLENPWGMQFLPDGRILVTERPGRMRIVAKDGSTSAPVTGLPQVVEGGQAGLLDVLLAPDFATSATDLFRVLRAARAFQQRARPSRAPS